MIDFKSLESLEHSDREVLLSKYSKEELENMYFDICELLIVYNKCRKYKYEKTKNHIERILNKLELEKIDIR